MNDSLEPDPDSPDKPIWPPTPASGVVILGDADLEQSEAYFRDRDAKGSEAHAAAHDPDPASGHDVSEGVDSDIVEPDSPSTGMNPGLAHNDVVDAAPESHMRSPEHAPGLWAEATKQKPEEKLTTATGSSRRGEGTEKTSVDSAHLDAVEQTSADVDPDVEVEVEVQVTEPEEAEEEISAAKNLVEWLTVLVGAVVVALIFRAFLFQAFYIPSASMEETLQIDDKVMVNRLSYKLHDVNRGDVVVFSRPEGVDSEINDLIKRVMALSGETIEGRDNAVYVNGKLVVEPYLHPDDRIRDFGPETVPAGHVFVMGDNRDNSQDSRSFGPIPEDTIVGRAFIIFWPFENISSL